MVLKDYVNQLIDSEEVGVPPDNYMDFGILCPEHSARSEQIKPYPLSPGEHLFLLVWNIHDGNKLSATAIPANIPFKYECGFMPGMRTQMHSHEYLEMFYVLEGEYRQRILGKEYSFKEGEICLVDQNCIHQEILSGRDAKVIFIGITNVMFAEILKRGVMPERIASFVHSALKGRKTMQQYLHFTPVGGRCELVEQCLVKMMEELKNNDLASGLICQGLLLRFFRALSTKYEFVLSKQLTRKAKWLFFEEITNYMSDNLANISVTMLSDKFHFQEDYFNRFIKGVTGLTYTEYLQNLRLRQAENLLTETDESIEEIVKAVGYKNKGYFYKIFEEQHGQTPAGFRKNFRERS